MCFPFPRNHKREVIAQKIILKFHIRHRRSANKAMHIKFKWNLYALITFYAL